MNIADHDFGLEPDELALLQASINAPMASLSATELAEAAQIHEDRARHSISSLLTSGWLDSWTPWIHQEPEYVLTPIAASRLGVVLSPSDEDDAESLRWTNDAASIRSRVRSHANPGSRTQHIDAARKELLDQIPDPAPGPDRTVCAVDYLDHLLSETWPSKTKCARAAWELLPLPTVLVGFCGSDYLPADEFDRKNPSMGRCGVNYPQNLQSGRHCPGCGGRHLRAFEYCPRCSRWGLDSLFQRLLRTLREKDDSRVA